VLLTFAITGASRLGTWAKGSAAQVLASESASLLLGESSMIKNPLEALSYTREKSVREGPNIPGGF